VEQKQLAWRPKGHPCSPFWGALKPHSDASTAAAHRRQAQLYIAMLLEGLLLLLLLLMTAVTALVAVATAIVPAPANAPLAAADAADATFGSSWG